jgi:orotate phosphoribosyltransferase
MSTLTDQLVAALKNTGALKFGSFTLASGDQSSYYIDAKKFVLSPDVWLAAESIQRYLSATQLQYDAIGGPALGAVPLVGAFLGRSGELSARIKPRGFAVRQAAKEHGLGGLVIGSIRPGDRCVLLEDVATKGNTILRTIDVIADFGASVVAVISLVDRTGLVGPLLAARGITYHSLLTPSQLGVDEMATGPAEPPQAAAT